MRSLVGLVLLLSLIGCGSRTPEPQKPTPPPRPDAPKPALVVELPKEGAKFAPGEPIPCKVSLTFASDYVMIQDLLVLAYRSRRSGQPVVINSRAVKLIQAPSTQEQVSVYQFDDLLNDAPKKPGNYELHFTADLEPAFEPPASSKAEERRRLEKSRPTATTRFEVLP